MNTVDEYILSVLGAVITGFIAYVTSKATFTKPQKYKILNEQLYNVYLPLFKKIESNLYKNITIEEAYEYEVNPNC